MLTILRPRNSHHLSLIQTKARVSGRKMYFNTGPENGISSHQHFENSGDPTPPSHGTKLRLSRTLLDYV